MLECPESSQLRIMDKLGACGVALVVDTKKAWSAMIDVYVNVN